MKVAHLVTAALCLMPTVITVRAEQKDGRGNDQGNASALAFLENGFVANSCSEGTRSWVKCFQQKPEACEEIVRARFHVCIEKYAGDITSNMQEAGMRDMSMKLARCFRAEFLDRYGVARVQSAECAKVFE